MHRRHPLQLALGSSWPDSYDPCSSGALTGSEICVSFFLQLLPIFAPSVREGSFSHIHGAEQAGGSSCMGA